MKKILPLVGLCFALNTFAEEGVLSVTGVGTVNPDSVKNETQARMMAKRAAQVDAQRQLTEAIRGVRLSGGTTVEEMEVTSDIVATRVKGLLRGAFELDSKVFEEGGSYVAEVELGLCLDRRSPMCSERPLVNEVMSEQDEF